MLNNIAWFVYTFQLTTCQEVVALLGRSMCLYYWILMNNAKLFSKSVYINLRSYNQWMEVPVLPYLRQRLIMSIILKF